MCLAMHKFRKATPASTLADAVNPRMTTTCFRGLPALHKVVVVSIPNPLQLPCSWSLIIAALAALPVTVRHLEIRLNLRSADSPWLEPAVDLQLLRSVLQRFTDLTAVHFKSSVPIPEAAKKRIEGSLPELSRRGIVHCSK